MREEAARTQQGLDAATEEGRPGGAQGGHGAIIASGSWPGGVAPRAGLEPATLRLTAGCSTIELSGNPGGNRPVPVLSHGRTPAKRGYSISPRPSMALESATSSAYSRTPPTGSPRAMRLIRMPLGFSSRASEIAVASP